MKHLFLVTLVWMSATLHAQVWTQTRGPVEDNVLDLCIAPNGWLFAMTPFGCNRSTDGGETWTRPFRFGTPSDSSKIMVAPNGNIVFTCDTGIVVTTDLGETFTCTHTAINPPVRQLATSRSGRIFTCGPTGTFMSDDNGLTWRHSTQGVSPDDWDAYGIATSGDSVVALHDQCFISLDNGETWTGYPLGVPLPTKRITICPDGSWLIFTNRGLYLRKGINNWIDVCSGIFNYAETFIAYDRMQDGSVFMSSPISGLWRVRVQDTFWTSVNKGLETDSIRGTAYVTRVVEDTVNHVYYAATIGRGVCKSLPVSAVNQAPETVEIDVFPNPATTTVTVRCSLSEPSVVQVEVADDRGNTLDRKSAHLQAGMHDLSLVLDALPSGSFFLQVQAGRAQATKRITVLK